MGGRLVEVHDVKTGAGFEVGRVLAWEPGALLRFEFRGRDFAPGERTEVEVRFQAEGAGTRLDPRAPGLGQHPGGTPARHGFTGPAFVDMIGLWWADLLVAMRARRRDESLRARADPYGLTQVLTAALLLAKDGSGELEATPATACRYPEILGMILIVAVDEVPGANSPSLQVTSRPRSPQRPRSDRADENVTPMGRTTEQHHLLAGVVLDVRHHGRVGQRLPHVQRIRPVVQGDHHLGDADLRSVTLSRGCCLPASGRFGGAGGRGADLHADRDRVHDDRDRGRVRWR